MTAIVPSFHQNFHPEKKPDEVIEKDIRKWVESVVEFKASLDKQKNEPPLEKHLKKLKKFKIKKKGSLTGIQPDGLTNTAPGQRKQSKGKKGVVKVEHSNVDNPQKKESDQAPAPFDQIKESFRELKLPQNWTSGISSGRVVFNRIKITTQNSRQKVAVERSLIITKDRNVHVLLNGSEVALNNWEMQKIETIDDIKKAIREIDSLKISDGATEGMKSPQGSMLVNGKTKTQVCKTEATNPQKPVVKKTKAIKKQGGTKIVPKPK